MPSVCRVVTVKLLTAHNRHLSLTKTQPDNRSGELKNLLYMDLNSHYMRVLDKGKENSKVHVFL